MSSELRNRKLFASNFSYVELGEFAYTVECILKFGVEVLSLTIIRLRGDENLPAYPQQRSGKRLGDHYLVPGIQRPGLFEGNVKSDHGRSGGAGQQHRTWFGYVSRTTGPVDGEGHGRVLCDFFPHSEQRTDRAPAAGAADFHKTKFANNAARPFAVEAVTAHDSNLQMAPEVNCREDTVMPEGKDHWASIKCGRSSFFERNCDSQCRTYQADDKRSCPCNQI
jgi:hypothetical protein